MSDGPAEANNITLADSLRQAKVDEAVVAELEKWQQSNNMQVAFDRWLTPGKSKAVLAAVALTGPLFNGKIVMKVCPPGSVTGREPDRHDKALADAPEGFADRHLVKQPVAPINVRGGSKVMFQEVAGGSLRNVRALSVERGRELPELVGTVARSVLADWNPQPTDIRRMTTLDFVRIHLGTRLDRSGPVADLADQLVFDPVGEQVPALDSLRGGRGRTEHRCLAPTARLGGPQQRLCARDPRPGAR